MAKHTNRVTMLHPLVVVGYSDLGGTRVDYPTREMREEIVNAAEKARTIMRQAVEEMDRVVFFRRPEGEPFKSIMNYHFGLAQGRKGIAKLDSNTVDAPLSWTNLLANDRRSILNKIRMGILSISFHLNTGVYLIDIDHRHRTIIQGYDAGVLAARRYDIDKETDKTIYYDEPEKIGYVSTHGAYTINIFNQNVEVFSEGGLLCGFRNGEIHLSFSYLHEQGYNDTDYARAIIHEAAHKYWGVTDHKYSHNAGYDNLSYEEALDNADSYTWTAISLAEGHLIKGTRDQNNKWDDIPVP